MATLRFLLLALAMLFTATTALAQKADPEVQKILDRYNLANLSLFSKMIFLNDSGWELSAIAPKTSMEIIYNEYGYDEGVGLAEGQFPIGNTGLVWVIKRGKVATEPKSNHTIGYDATLPLGAPPRAVLVEVYGGANVNQRAEKAYRPGYLLDFHHFLLSQGIAIIRLNLPDLVQFNEHQISMPQALHDTLHKCIDAFFQILKNDPASLHADLSTLKGKPVVLFGGSFGGRTAVRHAELYPKTFSRYISADGVLDLPHLEQIKTGMKYGPVPGAEKALEWLSPMESTPGKDAKISRISEPVLVMHNLDDNLVSVNISKAWFDKARSLGKGDLVRFYTAPFGNAAMDAGTLIFKGHRVPTQEEALFGYVNVMAEFIVNGPSEIPAMSEWRAGQASATVNVHTLGITIEEKFLSQAYLAFKRAQASDAEAAKILDTQRQDEIWRKYYVPILYVVDYVETLKESKAAYDAELVYMASKNFPGHDAGAFYEKALNMQLPTYLQFLKEAGVYNNPSTLSIGQLAKQPALQDALRSMLSKEDPDPDSRGYILKTCYLANIDLIDKGLISPQAYQGLVAKWSSQSAALQAKFIAQLQNEKRLIQKTFQEAGKAVIKSLEKKP